MSTLAGIALTNITALRNRESTSPNIGTILAAEIYFLSIIPFSVVESALVIVALIFACVVILPVGLLLPFAWPNRFSAVKELTEISIGWISELATVILWSLSSSVMNLLPVKLLENECQAKNIFFCS